MIKAILVDLDGTLVDTKDVNYYSYRDALADFGFHLNYDYFCNNCFGLNYLDFLPHIVGEDKSLIEQIHKKKKATYKEYIKYVHLNDSLASMLRILHKETKICLVTTASKENALDILNYFSLSSIFDKIYTQEDVIRKKPDPEIYNKAMKELNVSPVEVIVFEDSKAGILAAKASKANVYATLAFSSIGF